MQTPTIDILSVNEFLGHEPRICEICEHREAAVLMLARDDVRTAKAHLCLECFEIAESQGFETIIESVSPQGYLDEAETWKAVNS